MPETSPSEERLESLRHRWKLDKTPRVLLQLADEFRKLNRAEEAIPLLEEGLAAHPGHLSFQIAIGRCRIEMGDAPAAIEILEEVIASDSTQLVANKALLKAYLEAGERVKANERLLHYSLLASGDPELEELTNAVAGMEDTMPPQPRESDEIAESESGESESRVEAQLADELGVDEPMPASLSSRGEMEDPFGSLAHPSSLAEPGAKGEVFGLDVDEAGTDEAPQEWKNSSIPRVVDDQSSASNVFSEESVPRAELERETTARPIQDPFGAVGNDHDRWSRAIQSEGIFAFDDLGGPGDSDVEETESKALSAESNDEADTTSELVMPGQESEPTILDSEAPTTVLEVLSLPQTEPGSELDSEQGLEAPPELERQSVETEVGSREEDLEVDVEPIPEPPPIDLPVLEVEEEEVSPSEPLVDESEDEPTVAEHVIAVVYPDESEAEEAEGLPKVDFESESELSQEVSATLGMLYLRQEHYGEARDIYSVVAQGQPAGSMAARRLELLRPVPEHALTASDLLAEDQEGDESERKRTVLRAYLDQIRKRAPRRVS